MCCSLGGFIRCFTGAILGGLVYFLWTAFSWQVLSWHAKSIHEFSYPEKMLDEVRYLIAQDANHSGVHVIPHPSVMNPMRPDSGPMIFMGIRPESTPNLFRQLAVTIGSNILAALVAMALAMSTRLTYAHRVMFFSGFGFAAALACHVPYATWWSFGIPFVAVECGDSIIGWTLAGLIMAGFIPGVAKVTPVIDASLADSR